MITQPLRIGSLNARSIFKEFHHSTQRAFISSLRSRSFQLDVLCLQETSTLSHHPHLTPDQLSYFTRFMFPNCSTVVTKHVAIICLRQDLSLDSTLVSLDERVVVASILDQQQHILCQVINCYVPAQSNARPDFLRSFMHLPFVQEVETGPWLLLGDFNMNLHSHALSHHTSVVSWLDWMKLHFENCMPQGFSTFTRGNSRTTIDYIFGHYSLMSRLTNAQQHHLPASWTDHNLLTIDLLPARQSFGPGSWRFNPTLLRDEGYITLLDMSLDNFFQELSNSESIMPISMQWESLKRHIQHTAQHYSRGSTSKRKYHLTRLQQERQTLLSAPQDPRLAALEKQIDGTIQQETQQLMLRSATRWHEQGERNNKYFYRVIKDRQTTQTIQSLRNLQTGAVFHESQDIITEAQAFYRQLYTPESIDLEDMEHLLSSIPSEIKLSMDAASDLLEKPSRLDLLDLIARTPLGKSPGLDGLPFELYRHLAPRSLAFCSLLLQIIHQAINGAFPRSWFDTRMVLLYKKGDPELLTNWRPLSLINADAKLFTKLIANRINHVLPRLINPYQTGFMPHRLISDNGWLNQVLMANARQVRKSDPLVAVLLDQEKAYDRVHPEYLRCVLLRFGFPPTLVDSLSHLFFGTQIHVSINGWLGSPFTQGRGLRQGDPLSPLLFNLAFEPLLRSILASSLAGVSLASAPALRRGAPSPSMIRIQDSNGDEYFDHISRSYSEPGPIVKMLSYADDLEVFLTNPTEWNVLLEILECYGRASNAKVNLSKTVMVSLSGQSHQDWISIASQYGAEWHDRNSHTATRYLGYPLYHNQKQLHEFLNAIKIKIARHIQLLKGRSLSIRGSSMVANSLLLSRTWHVLRVVPAPAPWLAEIKKLVRSFVLPFWPAPAWTTICLPRRFGGTSIIDIEDQALALHFVYIQRLCHPPCTTNFLSPWGCEVLPTPVWSCISFALVHVSPIFDVSAQNGS